MLRNFSVLFFLLLGLKTNANNFQKYLWYISKAENHIIENDYLSSQRYYDSAMLTWDRPFAIDIHNALKVANLNGDFKNVRSYAEKLIALGCSISFFELPDYLKSFRTTAYRDSLIRDYPVIRDKFLKKNNQQLRTTIESLVIKDQSLRKLDPNYSYLKDSIYKADDTIKSIVMQLIKPKFPNEYDYGVFHTDDTTLLSYEPLHLILLHNYSKLDPLENPTANKRSIDITDLLLDAVHNGNMHPEAFALLNDRSGEYQIGEGFGQMGLIFSINGKLYYNNESDKIKEAIEKNRSKIGLEDRYHARKKLIYDSKNNIHRFILKRSLFGITKLPEGVLSEEKINKMFIYSGINIK